MSGVGPALVALGSALRAAPRVYSLGRLAPGVPGVPVVLTVEIADEDEAKAVAEALTGRPYRRGDWERW